MTCAACARRVERALAGVPGVTSATVNAATETASLIVETPEALAEAARRIRAEGYGVRVAATDLAVEGMTCAACAGRVERGLMAVPGVLSASVNPATDVATVRFPDGAVGERALIAAVEAAGYRARAAGQAAEERGDDAVAAVAARAERIEMILAVVLTLPMVVQMALMTAGVHWHMAPAMEILLATPVQFLIGRRFYAGAWRALRARSGNMDLLVALGTSAAYGYSLWLVWTLGDASAGKLYFEASAVIITLIMLGKALEARAKRSAGAALAALSALRPERATVLRGGEERDVALDSVAVGDIVILRPGERAPVDGEIVKGASEFDESLITGESRLVARGVGEAVAAGALNGAGLVRLRAEHVGRDDTLARIARMVADAQSGKAPIQRLVDRISAVFVPVVVALAALTFGGWTVATGDPGFALIAAVSVLVIACPCALGLATPTALVAGIGAGARSGVLIRDVETLERAQGIDTVVFDKTGTLTEGAPRLVALEAVGMDRDALLALAASAQKGSEHPLGKAMVKAAEGVALTEPEDFRATPGEGVEATVEGRAVRIGRIGFVGGLAPEALDVAAAAHEDAGRSAVWISVDGAVAGLAALEDTPRADAAEAVARLKARGLSVIMLSGDNRATAERVGAALGVDAVIAEARPEDKIAAVAALKAEGRKVAMVGDGVNDAPALAAADLGLAMGTGADAARAAAGVTLMRPSPMLAPAALSIATATARVVRQNLVWAFLYNVTLLPVAALGLLNPAAAGAAMALSSLSVVLNALRLSRWRPEGAR
ncbi:MAG: cadmium-translocating P-type ATPase [Rhodobacteraceae bacterium]|nr:MAG: cadmium-translocating P-type ATPase [Paracoccaceae bacterium]